MTALRPGQSPPPVRIPTRPATATQSDSGASLRVDRPRRRGEVAGRGARRRHEHAERLPRPDRERRRIAAPSRRAENRRAGASPARAGAALELDDAPVESLARKGGVDYDAEDAAPPPNDRLERRADEDRAAVRKAPGGTEGKGRVEAAVGIRPAATRRRLSCAWSRRSRTPRSSATRALRARRRAAKSGSAGPPPAWGSSPRARARARRARPRRRS